MEYLSVHSKVSCTPSTTKCTPKMTLHPLTSKGGAFVLKLGSVFKKGLEPNALQAFFHLKSTARVHSSIFLSPSLKRVTGSCLFWVRLLFLPGRSARPFSGAEDSMAPAPGRLGAGVFFVIANKTFFVLYAYGGAPVLDF